MGQKSSVLPIADETIPPSANSATNHLNRGPQEIPKDEYPHFGIVSVQLSWLTANVRYTPEQQSDITVTGKGAIFFGSNISSPEIMSDLHRHKLFPREISLLDSRAHQLLVTYSNGWHAISSPEIFSRHSGTCIIIGDRQNPGPPYKIQLGDCFRLGSVGVVVSEIKTDKGIEKKLDNKRLQYLREEALAFETDQDEAALAAEEEEIFSKKKQKSNVSLPPTNGNGGSVGSGNGNGGNGNCPHSNDENTSYNFQEGSSPFFCYMCYETHDTPEDHLVAPCECKGDTRYLHVQCLQKWYQSSVCGSHAHVIRTTSNGAPACKICGAAYKTAFRNNGVKTSLLEVDHPGPYISLVVVTRHDTSPGLFNTKFRLNFGPNSNRPDEDGPTELSIGRSSLCNMVLDYRTVSTVHAKLIYKNGEFFVQDTHSSNGTMVYLQGPLPLVNNQTVRLRMGRSTLALQAKRSISASIRGTLQRAPLSTACTASLPELQHIMSLAPPYIPRSIRQVDQTADAVPEPVQEPAFRITDVNSWLHSIQNQAVNNVSAQTANEAIRPRPRIGMNSGKSNERVAMGGGGAGADAGEGGRGEEGEGEEAIGSIMEAPPGREISASRIPQSPRGENLENSDLTTPPRQRAIEFTSTPLPDEILNGGHNSLDGPIVLGGDRISVGGSRPNSARPVSAQRILQPGDPAIISLPLQHTSPRQDQESLISSRENSKRVSPRALPFDDSTMNQEEIKSTDYDSSTNQRPQLTPMESSVENYSETSPIPPHEPMITTNHLILSSDGFDSTPTDL